MRGRKCAIRIVLTQAERALITHWLTRPTTHSQLQRWGRILLLREQGTSITALSKLVGLSRPTVYKWLWKYRDYGTVALQGYARLKAKKPEGECI